MANFDANTLGTVIYSESLNPAIGEQLPPEIAIVLATMNAFGTVTRTQPITENAEDKGAANALDSFGFLDWYNRIHVYPLRLDLGNVVSVQVRTITAWNAFFEPHTLNDVIPANDTGIVMTAPAAMPLVFAPLAQYEWELQIATEGPPVVDATYTYDFDIIDFVVEVVGVRIVAWTWEANWIDRVLETLGWSTDVMQTYNGKEQRRSLTDGSRTTWEFTFDVQEDQRRLFENIVFGWGGRIWALPIWTDSEMLTGNLVSGSSVIPVETTGRDYRVGGLGVVIGPDGTYESFEVTDVNAGDVHIQTPIVTTWPPGSKVFPARTARLLEPRSTQRFHRNYARGRARFRSVEEIDREALTEFLYRDLPVMEIETNWREAPDIDYARKLAILDLGFGRESVTDQAEIALPTQSFVWTMLAREDVDTCRKWLYARKGRCKGVWLPTWSDDLILANTITAAGTNAFFQFAGLTYFAQASVGRRDIRLQLKDGNVFYRRISDFQIVDANTERVTLNTVMGQTIEPDDIERISWMYYMRLDHDAIELAWISPDVAEATLIFRGPNNEL